MSAATSAESCPLYGCQRTFRTGSTSSSVSESRARIPSLTCPNPSLWEGCSATRLGIGRRWQILPGSGQDASQSSLLRPSRSLMACSTASSC